MQFLGPHNKPHGVRRLCNSYHMRFDKKLGHGTSAMHSTSCAFPPCTYIIDQPWDTDITEQQQPSYKNIKDCTYWTVLGSFNN